MALPKPPGERERRNADQRKYRTITRGAVPAPPMPGAATLPRLERQVAEEYWRDLWADYGEIYTAADRHPIARLCRLHARSIAGRRGLSAQAEGELRQLENAYGASPVGRLKLMVIVKDPDGSAEGDQHVDSVVVDMDAQRRRRERMRRGEEG